MDGFEEMGAGDGLDAGHVGDGAGYAKNAVISANGESEFVAWRRRMECVILECRPAEELLPIYDTPQTLFFLDPPYVGTGHLDSYNNYTPERLEALAKQIRALKGRFILTIDDRPEHRVLFEGYTQHPVTTAANMRPGHTFSELIVHNVCDVAAAQAAHDEPRHRHLPEVTP